MKAKEMRYLSETSLENAIKTRPLQLKEELLHRMEERAKQGHLSLDFVFSDIHQVITETIKLFREEGFVVYQIDWGFRFEW